MRDRIVRLYLFLTNIEHIKYSNVKEQQRTVRNRTYEHMVCVPTYTFEPRVYMFVVSINLHKTIIEIITVPDLRYFYFQGCFLL